MALPMSRTKKTKAERLPQRIGVVNKTADEAEELLKTSVHNRDLCYVLSLLGTMEVSRVQESTPR